MLRKYVGTPEFCLQFCQQGYKHLYWCIENELQTSCQNIFGDNVSHIIVVEMSEDSFEVFVEVGLSEYIELTLIGRRIVNCLQTVVFFKDGTLASYIQPNRKLARFSLRDDVICYLLEKSVVKRWTPEAAYHPILSSGPMNVENCENCFADIHRTPLSMADFDLVKKWILDVPL